MFPKPHLDFYYLRDTIVHVERASSHDDRPNRAFLEIHCVFPQRQARFSCA